MFLSQRYYKLSLQHVKWINTQPKKKKFFIQIEKLRKRERKMGKRCNEKNTKRERKKERKNSKIKLKVCNLSVHLTQYVRIL